MTDYTQITDFSAKDDLPAGNTEKIILGADIDAELSAIVTAITSKYDSNDLASTAQATAGTSQSVLMTPLRVQNFYDEVVQTKHKTALTSRNTTTTVADDPHLAGWTVKAAEYYMVEGFLVLDSSSATPDFDFLFDSNQTLVIDNLACTYVDEGGASAVGIGTNSITSTEITVPIGASDAVYVFIKGIFLGHATLDATVDFQWAQNVSNATDVTLNAGSWIKFTKIS